VGESSIRDILAAVQEQAISAETAASWLEMRIAEARQPRPTRAYAPAYAVAASAGDEMSDEEADLLFPPRTSEEADGRARAVRATAPLSDDELYGRIFGPLGAAGWG
jgi:hypothetical protein